MNECKFFSSNENLAVSNEKYDMKVGLQDHVTNGCNSNYWQEYYSMTGIMEREIIIENLCQEKWLQEWI